VTRLDNALYTERSPLAQSSARVARCSGRIPLESDERLVFERSRAGRARCMPDRLVETPDRFMSTSRSVSASSSPTSPTRRASSRGAPQRGT